MDSNSLNGKVQALRIPPPELKERRINPSPTTETSDRSLATDASTTSTAHNASPVTVPQSAPTIDSHGRLLPGRTGLNGSVRGPGGRFMKASAAPRAATTASTTSAVESNDATDTAPIAATTMALTPILNIKTPQEERQAIVDDFDPITVQLPAVLQRSLILIRTIDQQVAFHQQEVHARLQLQKAFPMMPPAARPDAKELRAKISFHLDQMEFLRRTSVEEARNMVARVRQNMKWLEDAGVAMIIRGLVDKTEGRTSSGKDSAREAPGTAEEGGEDGAWEDTESIKSNEIESIED